MCVDLPKARASKGGNLAFTLAEVVVAIAIMAFVFGGLISAYVQATRRAEWSGYSLAAQAMAIQQLEQACAGRLGSINQPLQERTHESQFNLLDVQQRDQDRNRVFLDKP